MENIYQGRYETKMVTNIKSSRINTTCSGEKKSGSKAMAEIEFRNHMKTSASPSKALERKRCCAAARYSSAGVSVGYNLIWGATGIPMAT